ncbi:MAG: S41 family peptidase [Alistipes sp.]|jgi:carboxyl-terminal processing protease|nr:S41 family peptidase [Alistipes sp.]
MTGGKTTFRALCATFLMTLWAATANATPQATETATTTATPPRTSNADFELGQNVELAVGMMRGIFMYYVDPVDADALGKGAAAGMVGALDPYTELIHADEAAEFELATTGKYGGIGSIIRQRGDEVLIAEPYKDSPADRAGLQIGDAFVEIAGRSAAGMTTADVSAALKGEAGTEVTIKVRKHLTGDEQTLSIRREVIALPPIPYYGMAADSVGYIHHAEFTDGCADELRAAFADLKSRGARSLILDYRGNGGGIMQEAVKILALFVPKGTEVLSMRGRSDEANKRYVTLTEPLDTEIPIAVLVDGYSASAAEIVAGALQDLDRGVVVGQRTFGKGLVQSTLPLGFDSYLKITTAKYYIPSGRCVQAVDYSAQAGAGAGAGAQVAEDETGHGDRHLAVPDSLIKEFRTAGGRRVYDGGGVMPDVRLDAEYSTTYAYVAYAGGHIDEFADGWMLENRGREVVPGKFALTDADYAGFVRFMEDKDLDHEPLTAGSLEALRRSAEAEKLIDDRVRGLLDSLSQQLDRNSAASSDLYRAELTGLVEDAVVLRHHYRRGLSEHNLVSDKAVAAAVESLRDQTEYRHILAEKDTDKK